MGTQKNRLNEHPKDMLKISVENIKNLTLNVNVYLNLLLEPSPLSHTKYLDDEDSDQNWDISPY